MKSKDGFVQAYNAQAVVDAEAQIIVAQGVTQSPTDRGQLVPQLVPMTDAVESNMRRKPEQLSADAGYCSQTNLAALEARGIDAYVATGRARDAVLPRASETGLPKASETVLPEASENVGGPASESVSRGSDEPVAAITSPQKAVPPTRVETMREKIRAGGHESPYRLRKQLPEPVFGQIKQARGFRQFLLRGLEKVAAEWAIGCTAHNITKLFQGRRLSAATAATN